MNRNKKPTEDGYKFRGRIRPRFICQGSEGARKGDVVRVRLGKGLKVTDVKAEVLERYYTLNIWHGTSFRNYAAKVLILEGTRKGDILRTHRICKLKKGEKMGTFKFLKNCEVCGKETWCNYAQICKMCDEKGWWMDPAGGLHSPYEEDPAAMYE